MNKMQSEKQHPAEFLVELAHDMRNCLATLRGAAHLIAKTDGKAAYTDQARRAFEQQIERLAAMINTLTGVAPAISAAPVSQAATEPWLANVAGSRACELTGAAPKEHMHILIADDNDDAAMSLAMILQFEGHTVSIAHDGVEALELAEAWRPNVALVDLNMPRKDGFEVAMELQSRSWGHACQLIALSGWNRQQDRDRALAAGFSTLMTKPIEIDCLLRFLQTNVALARG